MVKQAQPVTAPVHLLGLRAGMFAKNNGMRIDLVYATEAVAGRVRAAYVDREARKGKGPSDHAPVVVDLN